MTHKWKKAKITVALRSGPVTITAHVYGGLAVHKVISDGKQGGKYYVITHIQSGMSLTSYKPMDCLDGAKACVETISTAVDWSLSSGDMLAKYKHEMKNIPREIDRFRDYNLRRTFRI